MKPATFMLIAGEPSGDQLGAELTAALREQSLRRLPPPQPHVQPLTTGLAPRFVGAGGPRMAAAGVDLAADLTRFSAVGVSDVLRQYRSYRAIFQRLRQLGRDTQPDAIIGIDFSEFNRRFARVMRQESRPRPGPFHNWRPWQIKYVSPQVWASRAGRVYGLARDYDLLLSIFPFEPAWYARRVPGFPVVFVGHPIMDRYAGRWPLAAEERRQAEPLVVLLPGSRRAELQRHTGPILGAAERIARESRARFVAVLPDADLAEVFSRDPALARLPSAEGRFRTQVGGLPEVLSQATLAMASTGTVTMECAYFGVPTVALYRTAWLTYQIGRRVVKVDWLSMPNILANEPLFPEFIQHQATPDNLARAALELLRNPDRRKLIRRRLGLLMRTLATPGGTARQAAAAILDLMEKPPHLPVPAQNDINSPE